MWCILLSCYIPLSALIIYQLVQHRMNQRLEDGNGGGAEAGLIGGLIQIPLPIPEIISSLNRQKFTRNPNGTIGGLGEGGELATQCAICWGDFKEKEEVTPLLCDERHLFHTRCIEAWIRKGHNSCPLCRK